jgi:glycosyltransferase involved in cell wall biosynthesis
VNNEAPLLSIICPTYNQEKYIAQTLDSFLMQETKYSFEIIVHDDASTDNTAAIVREYEKRYPDRFANIYQTENQFSKAINNVNRIVFAAARGKYVALCEGDDFWTDAFKIEKQVGFLETHPDYTLSIHSVNELHGDQLVPAVREEQPATYTIEDLAEQGNFIHTVSVIFKRTFEKLPDWFIRCAIGDFPLHMITASKGKIYYMPESMAVYRRFTGVHSPLSLSRRYIPWYRTVDVLVGCFNDANIDRLLRQQQVKCLLHWYENNDEDILDEQAPLVKATLDKMMIKEPAELAKFKIGFLLAGLFKKMALTLAHNPVANKLRSARDQN